MLDYEFGGWARRVAWQPPPSYAKEREALRAGGRVDAAVLERWPNADLFWRGVALPARVATLPLGTLSYPDLNRRNRR